LRLYFTILQPWWAEETSYKNIKNLTDHKLFVAYQYPMMKQTSIMYNRSFMILFWKMRF